MKYRLEEVDYLELYPWVSPSTISFCFEGSMTARGIEKLYKRVGLSPRDVAIKEIIDTSYGIADIEVPENIWRMNVEGEIARRASEAIEKIKKKEKEINGFLGKYLNGIDDSEIR